MVSSSEDYFNYVVNVLGVKSLYLDANDQSEPGAGASRLLIVVEDLLNYSNEEKELLEKMISALKLDLAVIKIGEASAVAHFKYEFKVNFVNDFNPDTQPKSVTEMVTFSPRTLLKTPAKKKQAWSDLQRVIQFFSSK
jgi:hypothetical protein